MRNLDSPGTELSSWPTCRCLEAQYPGHGPRRGKPCWRKPKLHQEPQDTHCEAWEHLLELVETAVADGREEFVPGPALGLERWRQIVTLPATIAKLKSVRHLNLYHSALVRIPPEIGSMTALEKFTPYTSYRLHWFPYEITRCAGLRESTVSTRALYGNYKYRAPFPKLPHLIEDLVPSACSVCGGEFTASGPLQYWVSRRVATDVLPLLVHACSQRCVDNLPDLGESVLPYMAEPHQGGLSLPQPETYEEWLARTAHQEQRSDSAQ